MHALLVACVFQSLRATVVQELQPCQRVTISAVNDTTCKWKGVGSARCWAVLASRKLTLCFQSGKTNQIAYRLRAFRKAYLGSVAHQHREDVP